MSAIQVAIRIKPLSTAERGGNTRSLSSSTTSSATSLRSPFALDEDKSLEAVPILSPWTIPHEDTVCYDGTVALPDSVRPSGPLSFTFDFVYGENASSMDIYGKSARPLIASAVDGMNATIFAYGQTSSGKTFTMQGSGEHAGLIPLAIQDIFTMIHESTDKEFLLRVSYLEIYNEVITDLLKTENTNLKIHETVERGIFVGNLSEEFVSNEDQVLQLMKSGEEKRRIAQTNMNDYSSRSHTIFRMVIESRDRSNSKDADSLGAKDGIGIRTGSSKRSSLAGPVKVSCLNLVDLAGSERVGHTGAEGTRLKEGAHINKSLLALGSVISRLADICSKASSNTSADGVMGHVPFRDSKLTRILQPALGGNSKTLIICTLNASPLFFDESLSTLKFASRARLIQNKPQVNAVVSSDAMLMKYKKQIDDLENQLEFYRKEKENITANAQASSSVAESLKTDREREKWELKMKLELFERCILKSGVSTSTVPLKGDGEDTPETSPSSKRKRRKTWFSGSEATYKKDAPVKSEVAHCLEDLDDDKTPTKANIPFFLEKELALAKKENKELKEQLAALRESNNVIPEEFGVPCSADESPLPEKAPPVAVTDQNASKNYEKLKTEFDELDNQHLKLLVNHEEISSIYNRRLAEFMEFQGERERLLREKGELKLQNDTLAHQLRATIGHIEEVERNTTAKDKRLSELEEKLLRHENLYEEYVGGQSSWRAMLKELEDANTVLKLKLIETEELKDQLEDDLALLEKKYAEKCLSSDEIFLVYKKAQESLRLEQEKCKRLEIDLDEIQNKASRDKERCQTWSQYCELLEGELDLITNGQLSALKAELITK